jgi:hypothetical protein
VKGHHFESTDDIQRAVTQAIKDILQAAVLKCYKQWQHRWKRCVQVQGMYFEGENIVVDKQIKYIFGTSLITLLSDLIHSFFIYIP